MEQFQIGDVVQLKSGGPKMTVTTPKTKEGLVEAKWFSSPDFRADTFPPEALTKDAHA